MATTKKNPSFQSNGFDKSPQRAAEAGRKGKAVQMERCAIRKRLLATAIDQGLEKHFADAVKKKDMELIRFCAEAMKLVGLDYASEMVHKVQVDADVKSKAKVDHTLNITFSDAGASEG